MTRVRKPVETTKKPVFFLSDYSLFSYSGCFSWSFFWNTSRFTAPPLPSNASDTQNFDDTTFLDLEPDLDGFNNENEATCTTDTVVYMVKKKRPSQSRSFFDSSIQEEDEASILEMKGKERRPNPRAVTNNNTRWPGLATLSFFLSRWYTKSCIVG